MSTVIGRRALLALAPALLLSRPGRAAAGDAARLRFEEIYTGDRVLSLEFSDKAKALVGRRVVIRGYMAPPLKAEASFFVLTSTPVGLCPYCNSDADWPADLLVVYPGREAEFVKNSIPIDVTGILEMGPHRDPATRFFSRLRLTDAAFRALE
ncbi:hypothetical protein [Azospirillum thermophilum]|uniref:DUF3299 domain-containing protein n=1 Tax=Azospirillum thermophilum TaxID=2202148 RepID=A0A2S2CV51_9PROT|nr:hypothetical protein [Azospirillum thermophilum]AWK88349.1 hypothetical protein DEW08_19870 [Azospirillum thermophilum]